MRAEYIIRKLPIYSSVNKFLERYLRIIILYKKPQGNKIELLFNQNLAKIITRGF